MWGVGGGCNFFKGKFSTLTLHVLNSMYKAFSISSSLLPYIHNIVWGVYIHDHVIFVHENKLLMYSSLLG